MEGGLLKWAQVISTAPKLALDNLKHFMSTQSLLRFLQFTSGLHSEKAGEIFFFFEPEDVSVAPTWPQNSIPHLDLK